MPLHVARNTAFCHAAILDHSEWPCRPLGGILAALVARCATVGQGPGGRGPGVGGRRQGRQPTSLTICPRGDVRGPAHAFGGARTRPWGARTRPWGTTRLTRHVGGISCGMPLCVGGNVPRDKRLRTAPLLCPVCRWHLERNAAPCLPVRRRVSRPHLRDSLDPFSPSAT